MPNIIEMVPRKSFSERTRHHHWHWISEGLMLGAIFMLLGWA